VVEDPTFGNKISHAGSGGMQAAKDLLTAICVAFVASAPILVPLLAVAFGILYYVRSRRRRLAAAAVDTQAAAVAKV